jgi:hypothetical protein
LTAAWADLSELMDNYPVRKHELDTFLRRRFEERMKRLGEQGP